MEKWIEFVINVSEGRDKTRIIEIEKSLSLFESVYHLHTDIGYDTNRSVFTFVGRPKEAIDAAFKLICVATNLIDMRKQKGEHPRIGAVDVVPIIPLLNVTMDEAKEYARALACKVVRELEIPIFFYAKSASNPDRRRLPFIRRGDYEGLGERMRNGFIPDKGPHCLPLKTGAMAMGARSLMLAFNINLASRNVEKAIRIAKALRTSGSYETLPNGDKKTIPGIFSGLQAKGWLIEEYNCAQITTNIHNLKATPPHLLYDKACELAKELNEEITGSELIGMTPLCLLTETGKHALKQKKIKLSEIREATDEKLIQEAILYLGLNSVRPFLPEEQILEKKLSLVSGYKIDIFEL